MTTAIPPAYLWLLAQEPLLADQHFGREPA